MATDLTRQSQSLLEAIAFFKDGSDSVKGQPREMTLVVERARTLATASNGHHNGHR
jgi:hypothetical protein